MDMSHELTPSGEGSKNGKRIFQPEQQPATENIFDTRIKALFSNKRDYYRDSDRPSATEHVETVLSSKDRFTDNWWKGLYKWLDERDFHHEKYLVAEAVFDTLPSFPKDAKLPRMFAEWASGALKDPQQRQRIINTLDNSEIPSSLREQIPTQLARQPGVWSLDLILKGYKLFGEPVGQEMRKNIVPLFMSGLAVEEVFSSNRDALAHLYVDTESDTQDKKSSILSRVSQHFNKFRVAHHLPSSTSVITPERKRDQAERRVVAIRDLVRELYPTHEEYYNRREEFERRMGALWNPSIPPNITKEDRDALGRLGRYESEIKDQAYNRSKVSQDASSLPIDTLERYMSDIRQLRTILNFVDLTPHIMGGGVSRGILAPYSALGTASTFPIHGKDISPISIFNHLNELDNSGSLDDRITDEFLFGINSHFFSSDQVSPINRRNLKLLIKNNLPRETYYNLRLVPLLTISDEKLLKEGLETAASIQGRDNVTAVLLLEALPKSHAFGDKYKTVLDYVKRKKEREDLRRIGAFKHQDKVSEDLKKIQLTDSGTRQGERLVKLTISLDAISELNEALQLGISDAGIVPDLRKSYENVQDTLKGIFQKLGLTNLEEVYKFLPFIKTKDETALRVLRGEEVAKIGEARSYSLQASSKFDLEGMKKEIENYAQAIGLELPEIPFENLNLESLKQMASYLVAELSKRKDISEEVLREVKPNLDRIRTTMDKGGSYTFSINPQDMKSQLEALQNVSSCLSPGGSMFRYTKEYLKNPNTFWAIIKGQQGAVGRVTMFQGKDESGNPAFARVSRVYAQVPIDEGEVDKALINYAAETKANFVERGELTVPGLQDFYDDFIGTGWGPAVEVKR